MRENRVRSIWKAGGGVANGWLHIPSAFAAEIMAHQGWDSLTIDLQHGPVDYQAALGMLQAISTTDVTPLARVPWNEPGIIMKLLDAGCMGIICPMINSRHECEAFVGACRYPPHPGGYRSHGPTRAIIYAGSDYPKLANESVITMAMIETKAAVDNLDDILSVPGLDSIYVGPADLAQSYGRAPQADHTDPEMVGILDRILDGCRRHNIVAGLHCNAPEYAAQMFEKGFQLATVASDGRQLAMAASAAVATLKGRAPAPSANKGPY